VSDLPQGNVLALIAQCPHCGRNHQFSAEQISSEGKIKRVGHCSSRHIRFKFPIPNDADRLRDEKGRNIIINATLSHDMSASYACPVCRAEHPIDLGDLLETVDGITGVEQFCRGQYFQVFLERAEYARALGVRCESLPRISDDAEYLQLAPGSRFIAPDGSRRVKPLASSNQLH